MIGVRVPETMRRKLKELAAREGTTAQQIIAELIEERFGGARTRKAAAPTNIPARY
jgi:predicted DNA-binding protein